MSQELERVYTINLGKVLLTPDNQRAKRAINMIREFARHHMKTEDIKIEEDVAHQIWSRGIKHPPRKIRVRLTKTDEGYILVSPYDEEIESAAKPDKEKESEEKVSEEATKESTEVEAEIETEPEKETKEEVKKPLDFVDLEKGAEHYVKRYLKEAKYKAWFKKNYPKHTIYDAVGISESEFHKIEEAVKSKEPKKVAKPKTESKEPKKVAKPKTESKEPKKVAKPKKKSE